MIARKWRILISACTLCSLIISCTAAVNSSVRPGYVSRATKMFILTIPGSGSKMFLNGLVKHLSEQMSKYGMNSTSHMFNDMNPDEKSELRKKVQEYNPGLILEISQTVKNILNGAPSGGLFELRMYEPGDSAYVWKANLKTHTSGYAGTGIPSQAANNIVKRMLADRIIGQTGSSSPDL